MSDPRIESAQNRNSQRTPRKNAYKGLIFDEPLRFDVLLGECLLLELKSVQEILPIHKAQLLSYMKLLNVPLGLLINFHELKLVDGIHRLILPGANEP